MNPAPAFPGRLLRRWLCLLVAPFFAFALGAADVDDVDEAPARSPEELDKLVAPIALYPDALVALILPAATVPTDVTLAARYLASGNDQAGFAAQPWDESVKALARYPEVIKWMDENLAWTREVGEAFANQSADVMNAVQRMRARAQAAGTLQTTPQQEVVVRDEIIYIEPAQPDVIYVPRYDYDLVYGPPPWGYAGPFLSFGIGYPIGAWLTYDLDWHRRTLWRDRVWRRHGERWHHVPPPIVHVTPRPWRPPHRVRPHPGWHDGRVVVHPRKPVDLPRAGEPRAPHVVDRSRERRNFGHGTNLTSQTPPVADVSPRPHGGRPWLNAGTPRPSRVVRSPAPTPTATVVAPQQATERPFGPRHDLRAGRAHDFRRRADQPGTVPATHPPSMTAPRAAAMTPPVTTPRRAPAPNPPSIHREPPAQRRSPPASADRGDRDRRSGKDRER